MGVNLFKNMLFIFRVILYLPAYLTVSSKLQYITGLNAALNLA